MAKFKMRELPQNFGTSGGRMVPQLVRTGVVDLMSMAEDISHGTTMAPADVVGVVQALMDQMARHMADGKSVRVDGVGLFSASLRLNPYAEEETPDSTTHRTGQSVSVGGVNFVADKRLIAATQQWGRFERIMPKRRKGAVKAVPDAAERCELARAFAAEHGWLTVADYVRLTGLSRSAAQRELRRLADEAGSGLTTRGSGSHRVYVLR